MLRHAWHRGVTAATITIAMVGASLIGVAPATAVRWHRPTAVSYDGAEVLLDDFSGFVRAPDDRHAELVTLRERKGIVVYPIARGGRLGRGSFLPGTKNADYPWEADQAEQAAHGEYPYAAEDDDGLLAIAWQTQAHAGEVGTCNCAIHVDVGTVGGHFTSILLAQRGEEIVGVQVTRRGRVRVLWEADRGRLVLSEIGRPWRSVRRRAIPRGATTGWYYEDREEFLIEDAARPAIVSEKDGVLEVSLEPLLTTTNIDPAWRTEEDDWSLLSDGEGLTMVVKADLRENALEVALPAGAGTPLMFHPIAALVEGTTAAPAWCRLGADQNARAETLVAWGCYPGVIQAALLDPKGALVALSPVYRGEPGRSRPGVALDDAGRGVIGDGLISTLVTRDRFSPWQPIPHGPEPGESTYSVGVTSSGVALASWLERPAVEPATSPWQGRIEFNRSEPEPQPSHGTPAHPQQPD